MADALRSGVALLTWQLDAFAYAEAFDESAGRYVGLRGGQQAALAPDDPGLIVKSDIARQQLDAEVPQPEPPAPPGDTPPADPTPSTDPPAVVPPTPTHRRYHGTVQLDPNRADRDASQIAEEVIAHLVGVTRAEVKVTIEIEAQLPDGASEHVVRTVTENGRTLKFEPGSGFEED